MSLFDTMFNDHAVPAMTEVFGASVIAWDAGEHRVTAIQLPSGTTCTAYFHEYEAKHNDDNGTITNTIKGKLWVPTSVSLTQRSTWRIVRSNGSQFDVTGVSHGQRSGGLVCVEVEQVSVSKFAGAFR